MKNSTALLFVIATLVTSIGRADGKDLPIDGSDQKAAPVVQAKPSSSSDGFEKMSDKEAALIKEALADYMNQRAGDSATCSGIADGSSVTDQVYSVADNISSALAVYRRSDKQPILKLGFDKGYFLITTDRTGKKIVGIESVFWSVETTAAQRENVGTLADPDYITTPAHDRKHITFDMKCVVKGS